MCLVRLFRNICNEELQKRIRTRESRPVRTLHTRSAKKHNYSNRNGCRMWCFYSWCSGSDDHVKFSQLSACFSTTTECQSRFRSPRIAGRFLFIPIVFPFRLLTTPPERSMKHTPRLSEPFGVRVVRHECYLNYEFHCFRTV